MYVYKKIYVVLQQEKVDFALLPKVGGFFAAFRSVSL
jgi:hypothetical protein